MQWVDLPILPPPSTQPTLTNVAQSGTRPLPQDKYDSWSHIYIRDKDVSLPPVRFPGQELDTSNQESVETPSVPSLLVTVVERTRRGDVALIPFWVTERCNCARPGLQRLLFSFFFVLRILANERRFTLFRDSAKGGVPPRCHPDRPFTNERHGDLLISRSCGSHISSQKKYTPSVIKPRRSFP